jgi:hypothetical protein
MASWFPPKDVVRANSCSGGVNLIPALQPAFARLSRECDQYRRGVLSSSQSRIKHTRKEGGRRINPKEALLGPESATVALPCH